MLQFQLFGRPKIEQNGLVLPHFRSRKTEALLYYLAAAPGSHPRSRLADLLWPDLTEKKAFGNLRYALWNIRQVMDIAPLSVNRTTVAFDPDQRISVDLLDFQQAVAQLDGQTTTSIEVLQRAIALYQGDILSGFETLDAPPFNDWLRRKQAHYRSIVIELLERAIRYHFDRHQLADAMSATRRLLDIEPWHEQYHRQLMLMLALTGQRGEAIEQYHHCRRLLADDLGLEPEPETKTLFERIRRGDIDSRDSTPQPATLPAVSAAPFLGRAAESAWLLNQWQAVEQGNSRLALIGGEAGIGKTRLVTEVERTLTAQGGRLLRGRCFEYSGPVAYQPVAEALRPILLNVREQAGELNDIWLAELAQWVPELRDQYPRLPMPIATDRYRLFEAARQLFRRLTQHRRLAFFVDDLHWADPDSLDLLSYLVRQCDRLLLIGTYRPEETLRPHPLPAWRDGLYRTNRVAELHLERLSRPVVTELVEAVGSSPQTDKMTNLLYRLSAGNPFILLETVQEMKEHGGPANFETASSDLASVLPQPVQATIQRRLDRLPPESRQVLSLAAVIGREFDADLLQAGMKHEPAVVLDTLDDLLQRNLIRQVSGADDSTQPVLFDFSHDLIRTVLVQKLSPLRRQAQHRLVALSLQQRQQANVDVPVAWLAHHFHQAADHQAALTYLQQAGQQARAVYALPLALERYRLAAHHWDQQYRTGNANIPLETYRQRWVLLRAQADILRLLGQVEAAYQLLEQVETEVARWGDAGDRLQGIIPQLAILPQLKQLERCRQLAHEGLRLAGAALDAVAEGDCHVALGHCDRVEADYTDALSHYEAALINYTQAGETEQAAACLHTIAESYLTTNQFERALACIQEAAAYAESSRQQDILARSWLLKARTLLWLGQYENGLNACEKAITLSQKLGLQPIVARGLALQGYLHLLTGQEAAAHLSLQQGLELAQSLGHPAAVVDAHFYRGLLDLALRNPAAAQGQFDEAGQHSYLSKQRQIELVSYRAVTVLALGQTERAVDLSRQAVTALLSQQNAIEGVQRIYLNYGHILHTAGQQEAAQQARLEALEIAQQQAAAISAEEARQRFWQVPWNRELRSGNK